MTAHDFKGIPSLQEVECSGATLNPEVKLLSLQLHRLSDNTALAFLNTYTNNCMTFGDFSSCFIDPTNAHRSKLRILVVDLDEGESRHYGCTVNTMDSYGNPKTSNWRLAVTRESE